MTGPVVDPLGLSGGHAIRAIRFKVPFSGRSVLKPMRWKNDPATVILSVAMIATGILAFVGTRGLPEPALEPIGPAAFPRATSLILAFLAAWVLVRTLLRPKEETRPKDDAPRYGLAFVMVAATVIYVAGMDLELVGYRIATVGYLFVLAVILLGARPRSMPIAAAVAVIVGVGTHFIFTKLLFIDLP